MTSERFPPFSNPRPFVWEGHTPHTKAGNHLDHQTGHQGCSQPTRPTLKPPSPSTSPHPATSRCPLPWSRHPSVCRAFPSSCSLSNSVEAPCFVWRCPCTGGFKKTPLLFSCYRSYVDWVPTPGPGAHMRTVEPPHNVPTISPDPTVPRHELFLGTVQHHRSTFLMHFCLVSHHSHTDTGADLRPIPLAFPTDSSRLSLPRRHSLSPAQ